MPRTRRAALASLAGFAGLAGGCLGAPGDPAPPACPATIGRRVDARVGLVGDVMLGRNVDDRWSDGPPAGVWGAVRDRLRALDGLVCNLECCVSDRGERTPGRGYYFRADPDWAVPALADAGVSVANLANNHVLDYGPAALADTRAHLADAGIAHPGAGPDLSAALAPAVVEIGGITVAVVAATGRAPDYAAGRDAPGTAYTPFVDGPTNRRRLSRALTRARAADPDLVVATLHWGPNWEVRPRAGQRRIARWLIDAGADAVHGHSAHVVQGVETYHGRPILYDTGDFVDDYRVHPDLHNDRSFLFELAIVEGTLDHLRLVPIEIVDERATLAGDRAAAWLRERIASLSAPLGTTVRRDGSEAVIPLSCPAGTDRTR